MFKLRNFRKLCVMTLKGYAKFKGKLIRHVTKKVRNLVNFHTSNRSSEHLQFVGRVLSKAYKDLDEQLQENRV